MDNYTIILRLITKKSVLHLPGSVRNESSYIWCRTCGSFLKAWSMTRVGSKTWVAGIESRGIIIITAHDSWVIIIMTHKVRSVRLTEFIFNCFGENHHNSNLSLSNITVGLIINCPFRMTLVCCFLNAELQRQETSTKTSRLDRSTQTWPAVGELCTWWKSVCDKNYVYH